MRKWLWGVLAAVTSILMAAAWQRWLPTTYTEVLGVATTAACVLLVVEQSIWNFPIGILSNAFFLVLYSEGRLFGDAGLQVVYIALGLHGWYEWLWGGKRRTARRVSRAPLAEGAGLALLGAGALLPMRSFLQRIHGAYPLLDATTTILSLAAQYLLNRKRIENWYVWIAADVLYIWLLSLKGYYLTAILYAGLIGLCVRGLIDWRRDLAKQAAPTPEGEEVPA